MSTTDTKTYGGRHGIITAFVLISALLILPLLKVQADENSQITAITAALDKVKVFYITKSDGEPLTISDSDGPPAVPVFFYRRGAENAKGELLSRNEQGLDIKQAQLGSIYLDLGERTVSNYRYALIANPSQLKAARRTNQDPEFSSVPVFLARNRSEQTFMTIQGSKGQVQIPVFFEYHRIDAVLKELGEDQPELEEALEIVALPLQTVLNDMREKRLPVSQVRFIPPVQ